MDEDRRPTVYLCPDNAPMPKGVRDMIELASDHEVEIWLAKHREDVVNVSVAQLLEVAEWLPIIGVPANDRKSGAHRERFPTSVAAAR